MAEKITELDKTFAPMEAKLVDALPTGDGWQFEPKWDGFRCLAFRDGKDVDLISKSGKSLSRYFPEIVALLLKLKTSRFVLDGELIISAGDVVRFDALQARLHPAESRILKLSAETPAEFMIFDALQLDDEILAGRPLQERRTALEKFLRKSDIAGLELSPATTDPKRAATWLSESGGALDGVIAKRLDEPYQSGKRAMLKVKQHRTADCVIGGFRYDQTGKAIGSLLLGLFDDADRLNHVGFAASIKAEDRPALMKKILSVAGGEGFSGKAPGEPSRWSTDKSADWRPLRPELVVEVLYDQVTADRFRHGTRILRWRPDKAPHQCRMDQLQHELRPAELFGILHS
ncbi:MAG: ligD [Sphingomonadales bacterium]|nr:ligD [Sphingomonadales bacterium]